MIIHYRQNNGGNKEKNVGNLKKKYKKNRELYLCNRHGWGTWIRTKEMSDSESDALPLGYTPMCLFIIHDLCLFDKCFLCKTLVFLRFRQDRKYRKEMLEINVFFTLGCQNNR